MAANGERTRLEDVDARLGQLELAWDQLLPSLLDSVSVAISEARGADRVHNRIDSVREDLDRLASRLDLNLIDLKSRLVHGGSRKPADGMTCTIVAVGAVAAAIIDGPRLLFARGGRLADNAIQIGRYPSGGIDIVAPAGIDLPFGPGSVRSIEVAAGFDLGSTWVDIEVLLQHWLTLLSPGAALTIERIDFEVLFRTRTGGDEQSEWSVVRRDQSFLPVTTISDVCWTEGLDALGFADVMLKRSPDGTRIRISAYRPEDSRRGRG